MYLNGNYRLSKFKLEFYKKKSNYVKLVGAIVFLINLDLIWGFVTNKEAHAFLTNFFNNPFLKDNPMTKGMQPNNTDGFFHFVMWYYFIVAFIGSFGIGSYLYEFFIRKKTYTNHEVKEEHVAAPPFPYDQEKLQLIIGLQHHEETDELVEHPKWLTVPERGLSQDFLIVGGKGTGKTQSCMYPFTKQMIFYKAYDKDNKAGMLILDVKGNYTKEAVNCAKQVNRGSDVIVMNLSGKYKYNPLYKPSLRPQVVANRLRTILELFSTQHSDSYWLDKAEVLLTQAIKLVRLYNKDYVTFLEVHKVVNVEDYLNEKIEYLQELEDRNKLTRDQKANFRLAKDYFLNEYRTLDTKISSVIKSEVTRMTQTFIDDPDISRTFCSPKNELNFFGFDDLVDTGKIVVLDMNIAEFRNLSKIIAAYLKLDFQTAAMIRLTREKANTTRPLVFISDEYQEYVTANDADFYAVSREAKCINVVSTQSYSSLLKTLKSEESLQTILTNLTNKIWLRTDDKRTAEAAVAQCGVVDKEDVSKSFNESAKPNYSMVMGRTKKSEKSFGESLNVSIKTLEKFKVTTFTVKLKTFQAIAYLSDGVKILPPTYVHLEPYFKDIYSHLGSRVTPAPEEEISQDFSLEDNYNFDSHKVEDVEEKDYDFEPDENEEEKEKLEDIDFDGFDDEDYTPTPKKKAASSSSSSTTPVSKEVEESLKDIEGIFD